MQETTTYVCLQPVRHNNKPYMPGDEIELTAEDAQGLKDCEAIVEPFDGNAFLDSMSAAAAADTPEDTEQLSADLAAANSKIETLNGDLATANSKITQLAVDLEAANSKVSQLTADLTSANSRADTLSSDLSAANSKVSQLTTNLGLADTKLSELTADLVAEKTKTEKLTADLATANAAIAAQPKTTTKKTDQAK